MKKITVLVFVLLLSIAMLAACGQGDDQPMVMTDREAWDLVETWLEEHPEMATPYEPTTIASLEDEMYVYNGEEYYHFLLNGYYWVDILLHPETGEMLSVETEESDEPVEPVIEPLMDYYDRYYSE